MIRYFQRLINSYSSDTYYFIEDLKLAFNRANDYWEIVECDNTTKLVIKNKKGILNYDPYIIFYVNDDRLEVYPCKNYDSSKDPDEQEGIVKNEDNNIERFRISVVGLNGVSNTNAGYSFLFPLIITDTYFEFDNIFSYMVFDCVDKDTGGIFIYSHYHQTADTYFLWYNNIWYGNTDSGLNNVKFTRDIDKSNNFRHYSSPTGSTLSSPISFFIDVNNDTSINEWQYVGCSLDKFTKTSNTIVNIKQEDGSVKLCYILPTRYGGIAGYKDDIQIINN